MTFSLRLKKWRVERKLSQTQAAKFLTVPPGTLRDWEQDRVAPERLKMEAVLARMKNN